MNDKRIAPKVVRMTPGEPRVPEPHAADYSAALPDAAFHQIDQLCPQEELSSGRVLQRFEW